MLSKMSNVISQLKKITSISAWIIHEDYRHGYHTDRTTSPRGSHIDTAWIIHGWKKILSRWFSDSSRFLHRFRELAPSFRETKSENRRGF
ncbi:unnamed protein product [Trichogramma brassicae]|uniref:Uncharacterized protein n=1 Tax=Trichogramma brassicae TaxID=86971 RepID=A0A6H5I6C7_9HYME|nr:unnamed protein product [Trichogramma brassicae]